MPRCLNGTAYIKKGSCIPCADKIKPVETYIGRDLFNEARVYLGICGRRPKGRPTHFPLKITFADRVETRQIPAADIPWHFAMPEFGSMPGLMIGPSLGNSWTNTHFRTYGMPGNSEFFKTLKEKHGAKSVEFVKTFQITPFVRQLAKIAHAFAVATKGLNYFKPRPIPLILATIHQTWPTLLVGCRVLSLTLKAAFTNFMWRKVTVPGNNLSSCGYDYSLMSTLAELERPPTMSSLASHLRNRSRS